MTTICGAAVACAFIGIGAWLESEGENGRLLMCGGFIIAVLVFG